MTRKVLTQLGFERKAKQGIFYALAKDFELRHSGDAAGIWMYLKHHWTTEFKKLQTYPDARAEFEPLVEKCFYSRRARSMRSFYGIVYDF